MDQNKWKRFLAENSSMGAGSIEGTSGDDGLVLEDDAWTENDGEEPNAFDLDGTVDDSSDFRSELEEDQAELDEECGLYESELDDFDVPDDDDDDEVDQALDDPDQSLNGFEDEDWEDDFEDEDEEDIF